MTISFMDNVSTVNDIVVKYVNHLLSQQALHQEMLMDRQGDAHWIKRIDEVRAENTKLEQKVQDLRKVNHDLTMAVETALKAERERSADLLNQLNDAALGPHVKEKDRLTRKAIDGDAAIVANREALEAHKRLSEQPLRGE